MTDKKRIESLIHNWLPDTGCFLVDFTVKPGNKVQVLIDHPQGLSIDFCASLSRYIENNSDREKEDFDLTVSSPGADSPFKVKEQYLKNIGRNVSVKLLDGNKLTGKLVSANENSFTILTKENKKGSKATEKELIILFKDTSETKVIITFNTLK